ncbi:penicillin acylase family protein [Belliella kenyensis]|uniref:Penicillin acylase family protein n=1 Tax=Belliella kenyensis TaxID=1472724 RepID=A0ABV8EG23_9BACT|nr:penicillin acylase family protein [Belliella kenyensis]MCH7400977.1 penicillin acylase family protein [Belliella kenyensis]MDN3603975.1 penicillin acylase family protein [Belliella kenyensis]
MRKILYFLQLIALIFSHSVFAQTDLSIWESYASRTEIIRDQWGVPHIYGKTDADAVFGMIYAQCEDDFNRVETNYINAMGRMAEVEGISQLYIDLRMKLYIDPEVVKEEYQNSPQWLKSLMDAWAAGINYFLHTHPEVQPKLISQFEPWMALTFSEGSIGGDIETISANGLKSFYGEKSHQLLSYTERDWEEDPRGSNGFAIAPKLTKSGNAMLMINPHTSFYFRPEVHMVSEEGLNAYGAVTWGQFFIYQGFSEYNGWMHTSAKADAIDHYALTVEKRKGKYHYKFGKNWRPFTEKKITVKYKEGNELLEQEFTAFYSHHGPVIRSEDDKWIAIALMVEREKALTQSYKRTKTKNHEEFKANTNLKTNSSNSTVYADKDGTIAYYHGNFIPKRDPQFDWRNVVDGSNPATDWQGLHEIEEIIYIENPSNGWIQHCNSDPFNALGKDSPKRTDYPAYVAWDVENARGINAVRILSDVKELTLEQLIRDVAYEPTLMAFERLVPSLIKAYHELPTHDTKKSKLKDPIDILSEWDLKTGVSSVGTSLAVFWGNQLMASIRNKERAWDTYIFDFITEALSNEEKLEAFEQAIDKLVDDFGTWNTPWGEINRFQRVTNDIQGKFYDELPSLPIGYNASVWGSLAAYGSRAYPNTKKWYGNVGNSFVAAVEFGEKVRAKSLLAGGQSGNPFSPHFVDQAEMYSKGEFKEVNYYREDVLNHARARYRPGESE